MLSSSSFVVEKSPNTLNIEPGMTFESLRKNALTLMKKGGLPRNWIIVEKIRQNEDLKALYVERVASEMSAEEAMAA
ncbi:hypothetical protein FE257_007901 [Aspergillus nanangensis]|uniref:Uncharacterized protein n=1 Tax=Aspergillus nanangensis TaxID=2582783 RepID=A0AAD4CXQ9_ASPNN|nr:hypothetical protein FE257_007901 [Aspergillus nanangensis]